MCKYVTILPNSLLSLTRSGNTRDNHVLKRYQNSGAKDETECGHPRPHRARPAPSNTAVPPGIKRPARKRSGPDPLRSSPSTDIPDYGHEIFAYPLLPRVRIFPARFQEPLQRHGDSRSLSEFPRVRIFAVRFQEPLSRHGDSRSISLSLTPSPYSLEYGHNTATAILLALRRDPRQGKARIRTVNIVNIIQINIFRVTSVCTACKAIVENSDFPALLAANQRAGQIPL